MQCEHSVAAHFAGDFDEAAVQDWAAGLRRQLKAPAVSLGLVFLTPNHFEKAGSLLELLRVHARVPLLVGCSSGSLIAGSREIEDEMGIVLGLFSLPGAKLSPTVFTQEDVEAVDNGASWSEKTGVNAADTNGWLTFVDPFHLDGERWLHQWNRTYGPKPILGGMASGDPSAQCTQLYLNDQILDRGGIGISVAGDVELTGVISQGCTPIGETWTITKVDRNIIHEIGNRPAYEILAETFQQLTPIEQEQARSNLFVGLVVNEYLEEFNRGDFLIRNLLGADPRSGAIAVGALPRAGQTLQFQRRAASAGTEDMTKLLDQAKHRLDGRTIFGGCLCSCNGRGHRLFGEPDHDASHIQEKLGPLGLAGFFCNGEIGPIGEKSFLHGYTASLALFVEKARSVVQS